jgi:hypothetical protein
MTRTHTHTHTAGFLWTRDQPVAENLTENTQQLQETVIHASRVIRTRHPSKQAAVGQHLRPRVHWSLLLSVNSVNMDYV